MTDREKQIEEMAGIIRVDYKEWLDITGCLPKGTSYYYECLGGAKDSAKKLYDNGFRKIIPNVDFVVRTSDLVKIREKATQDILQELFDMAKEQGKYPVQTPVNWVDNVNALAKKYDVKVK